jgi:CrcB protein
MTGWLLLAIPLGGVGAVVRVVATRLGERRLPGGAPVATATVNIVGATALGVIAGWGGDPALLVLGGGLLGGMTTFSTWMVETDAALRAGRARTGFTLVVVPLVLGALGYAGASALA